MESSGGTALAAPAETAAKPGRRPAYRLDKPFEWNAAHGPDFHGPWPTAPETPMTDFLGLPVRSTFGVAASILVNEPWVRTYARLGFDLLTYKTVRRQVWRSHPMPQWLPVEPATARALADGAVAQVTAADWPADLPAATSAGSLGMPSQAPEIWRADIGRCRDALAEGQALIVSVVATVTRGMSEDDVVEEFGELAREVRAAGAQAIEANLSCPNVIAEEGETFRDPALSARIAGALRANASGAPVLVKIGHLEDDGALAGLLRAVDGHADAVVMVNGVSRRVVDADGRSAYGPDRERAGIIGAGLRPVALDQVRRASAIIGRDGLALKIVGVGGVSDAAHAAAFREAGAAAVQCASAAAWNPWLACEIKAAYARAAA